MASWLSAEDLNRLKTSSVDAPNFKMWAEVVEYLAGLPYDASFHFPEELRLRSDYSEAIDPWAYDHLPLSLHEIQAQWRHDEFFKNSDADFAQEGLKNLIQLRLAARIANPVLNVMYEELAEQAVCGGISYGQMKEGLAYLGEANDRLLCIGDRHASLLDYHVIEPGSGLCGKHARAEVIELLQLMEQGKQNSPFSIANLQDICGNGGFGEDMVGAEDTWGYAVAEAVMAAAMRWNGLSGDFS